jgi:hypothetical protein
MCLFIKENQKPKIAKKAIVCYKLVEMLIGTPKKFRTWCRLVPIELGEEYISGLVKCENEFTTPSISKGLHSYSNLERARMQVRGSYYNTYYIPAIVKCEIPIGSTYYDSDQEQKL